MRLPQALLSDHPQFYAGKIEVTQEQVVWAVQLSINMIQIIINAGRMQRRRCK